MNTTPEDPSRLRRKNSFKLARFQACEKDLPPSVQAAARDAFDQWCRNPGHPGLDYKPIQGHAGFFEIRIGLFYRAIHLSVVEQSTEKYLWLWIGRRSDLERTLRRL